MLRHKPTFGKHLHRKRSCEDFVIKNKEKTEETSIELVQQFGKHIREN